MDFGEEGCNGSSKDLEHCEDLNLEFTGMGPGLCATEEGKDVEGVDLVSKELDSSPGMGSHGQPDKEEDVDLNKKTPATERKDGPNGVENAKDCSVNKGIGSISGTKLVINSCFRRKVFKSPSSFSYRRLIPFIMDMAKYDSSISKIDVVDVSFPCKLQSSNNWDYNLTSALAVSDATEHDQIDEGSDYTKPVDGGDSHNNGIQLPVKRPDLDDPSKDFAQIEGNIGLSVVEQKNHENGMNGVDELTEECVQTTPPDANVFSKLDIDSFLEKQPNRSTCSNNIFVSKTSQQSPARRNDTISKAKPALTPCSRLKIFKTSSFSYRRLLPFLMEVSESTSNIDQCPKSQKNFESVCHSVSLTSLDKDDEVNKVKADDLLDKLESEEQKSSYPTAAAAPINYSSADISPKMSNPIFSCSANLSNGSPSAASSKAISEPNREESFETDRTAQIEHDSLDSPGKLDGELPNNDVKICDDEANCLAAVTSCSTTDDESLPRESISEVSPPIYDTQLIKNVGLNQRSFQSEAFDHLGNQSHSPTKGILKRNPRGCRGLCNCLNCSSFRLQAERAFEFSRNQLLDAEEVSLDLINELTELRNLLEKSAVDGGDLVAIQCNQAKEACKKATEMEQLARKRLDLMNDDLTIHSRINPLQRPRVTFSKYIEEIAIPRTDLSTIANHRKKKTAVQL